MKKLIIVASLATFAFGCASKHVATIVQDPNTQEDVGTIVQDSKTQSLDSVKSTVFVTTMQHKIPEGKNVVYTPTFLFTWELLTKTLGGAIIPAKENAEMDKLSNSKTYFPTLNKNEYKTNVFVDSDTIKLDAVFSISLPFQDTLDTTSNNFTFNGIKVKAFGMSGYSRKLVEQTTILYYESDEKFVVRIFPKNRKHEILIAKGFDNVSTFEELLSAINACREFGKSDCQIDQHRWKYYFMDDDELLIPVLAFNYRANYQSLEGHRFSVNGSIYDIKSATQTTSFSINEAGSKVESEAELIAEAAPAAETETEKPKVKHLLLNKPFFILLKKYSFKNPYFILKVNNTDIMTKQENAHSNTVQSRRG